MPYAKIKLLMILRLCFEHMITASKSHTRKSLRSDPPVYPSTSGSSPSPLVMNDWTNSGLIPRNRPTTSSPMNMYACDSDHPRHT